MAPRRLVTIKATPEVRARLGKWADANLHGLNRTLGDAIGALLDLAEKRRRSK